MQFREAMRQKSQSAKDYCLPRLRERAEPGIKRVLDRLGFIEVTDKKTAVDLRLRTLEAFWAIKGLNYLLDPEAREPKKDYYPEIIGLREAQLKNDYRVIQNEKIREVVKRLNASKEGKKLWSSTLNAAFSSDNEVMSDDAMHRLTSIVEVATRQQEKAPSNKKKAIIFAHPAETLSTTPYAKDRYGFDDWMTFFTMVAGEALPYVGAATLYSELMMTGKFDVELVDFTDKEKINSVLQGEKCDLALISGGNNSEIATILDLNKKMQEMNIPVLNGGVSASTSDLNTLIKNGHSVFVGEVEGAGEDIYQWLNKGGNTTVFVRGKNPIIKKLSADGLPITQLSHLPTHVNIQEAYAPEKERSGYLKHRLIATEMMRPIVDFAGTKYEPPPYCQPHTTIVGVGCPNSCIFCATTINKYQGTNMRVKPLESIKQEWEAVRSRNVAVVDQNLTANGKTYFTQLLELTRNLGKKIAFQGELLFFDNLPENAYSLFDRSPSGNINRPVLSAKGITWERNKLNNGAITITSGDPEILRQYGINESFCFVGTPEQRKRLEEDLGIVPWAERYYFEGNKNDKALGKLLQKTILGFEVGLESPVKMEGTAPGRKDPSHYSEAVKRLNKLGLVIFGTSIVDFAQPNSKLQREYINKLLDWLINDVPVAISIPMTMTLVAGTAAYEQAKKKGALPEEGSVVDGGVRGLKFIQTSAIDPRTEETTKKLRTEMFSLINILKRLSTIRLSPKKLMFVWLFNLIVSKVFSDEMN